MEYLRRLKIGQKFTMGDLTGIVLKITKGYVQVRYTDNAKKRVEFIDKAGALHKFEGTATHVSEWSTETRVQPLDPEGTVMFEKLKKVQEATAKKLQNGEPVKGRKGGTQRAIERKDEKVVKDTTQLKPCKCGCGEQVKRTFKPGHDARYNSLLKKALAGTMAWDELPLAIRVEYKSFAGLKANSKVH